MSESSEFHQVPTVGGLYENWFLDYASYVILDRAVPHLHDGLKPVQRRILYSLSEMEDGRFNKAAGVIGNTMKYHPHGDASIGDAMVQIGQKKLLIETQGNWGDPVTGDSAAAARYIEARLSKFALEVVFNNETTIWTSSYDGRNKEPVTLPVKFPLILSQGADGIAVGLATKILPHNFLELIDASISQLKGEEVALLPDFPTGGLADFSKYGDGLRGGRVRVRAKITELDRKTLAITEIPFSTSTGSLIDSIVAANDKGKIKIRKIEDNTAKNVEILVHLVPGTSPDVSIDALYAFTDCEVSISPNACVILDDRPHFMGVQAILQASTARTQMLLEKELTILLARLEEKWHASSLEKIFIENKIYRDIEECETFEKVIEAIFNGLAPFTAGLKREVREEDVLRLTEIKIKRISKYDTYKADEALTSLEKEMNEVRGHLAGIVVYCIAWFERLRMRFGKGNERKTKISIFETLATREIALANIRFYVDRVEGFVGTTLKKDEFVFECSDLDEVLVVLRSGKFLVTKVSEKTFVGKDILHLAIFHKNDEKTTYQLIYSDGPKGPAFAKRFFISGITRDKVYDLTRGTTGSQVEYLSVNANGETETVLIGLRPNGKLKKTSFDYTFPPGVKARSAQGNIVSKYPVKKITLKSKGVTTLSTRKIFYDAVTHRLNSDGRGSFIGDFADDEKILTVSKKGKASLHTYELTNHFQDEYAIFEKFDLEKIYSLVYFDGKSAQYFVKRLKIALPLQKDTALISEHASSSLSLISSSDNPAVIIEIKKTGGATENLTVMLADVAGVKGLKAAGNRLSPFKVEHVTLLAPVDSPVTSPVTAGTEADQLKLF